MIYWCGECDNICVTEKEFRDWGYRQIVECPDCHFGIIWDVTE